MDPWLILEVIGLAMWSRNGKIGIVMEKGLKLQVDTFVGRLCVYHLTLSLASPF